MRVARHHRINIEALQQLINFVEIFIVRRLIFAGDVERMAQHHQLEVVCRATQGHLEPGLLPFIDCPQDAGINRD